MATPTDLENTLLRQGTKSADARSHATTMSQFFDGTFPLFKLPPELRAMVYYHAFISRNQVGEITAHCMTTRDYSKSYIEPSKRSGQLLRVCKVIHAEAFPVLYSFPFVAPYVHVAIGALSTLSSRALDCIKTIELRHCLLVQNSQLPSSILQQTAQHIPSLHGVTCPPLPNLKSVTFSFSESWSPKFSALTPKRPIQETFLPLHPTMDHYLLLSMELVKLSSDVILKLRLRSQELLDMNDYSVKMVETEYDIGVQTTQDDGGVSKIWKIDEVVDAKTVATGRSHVIWTEAVRRVANGD